MGLAVLSVCGVLANLLIGGIYSPEALGVFSQVFVLYLIMGQVGSFGIQFSILATTAQNNKNKLLDIIDTMTATSLCGLGQTAGSAIRSAIEYWPELFDAPIQKMTSEVKHG